MSLFNFSFISTHLQNLLLSETRILDYFRLTYEMLKNKQKKNP